MAKVTGIDVSDKAALLGFKIYYHRIGYRIENGDLDVLVTNLDHATKFLDHVEKTNTLSDEKKDLITPDPIKAMKYAAELGIEGSIFLNLWLEGDFNSIDKEFPGFNNDQVIEKSNKPSI